MILINQIVTYGYYAMTLLFACALAWNLKKTRDPQEAVLYAVILIPFILRVLHVK
jgi:ABC-type spermidine/putrescine transport system permease subunit I